MAGQKVVAGSQPRA